jgi:hypothetical protein
MTREDESSRTSTNILLKKNLKDPQTPNLTLRTSNNIFNNTCDSNPKKRLRQESSEMQSPLSNNPTVTKITKTNEYMEMIPNATFPPYTLILKNSQHNELLIDRKLIEQFILEWMNKNKFELDITGRFGHDKRLLIFANNNTSFEELFDQQKWPNKIANNEFEVIVPRIFPAAYSLVIHQFFTNWNINEVFEELKTNYPSLVKLTRMMSVNNKPLNLVRADFCSASQVKILLKDGRITIGHMKNTVKQYYQPVKIRKCMRCYSHQHNTNECTSSVQLCIRCGLDHPFNNNCQNQIKCANCGQDHYAGHSACPEVQKIRRQISQDQKIKRTQLLINHEQEQHLQHGYNSQAFPPLPSTPMQQQQHQERVQVRPRTYASAFNSQQQTSNKNSYKSDAMENILLTFTNKIDNRLQQLEERLISQVIEIDKKIDKLKYNTNELESVIYETMLPAIRIIQKYSINNTRNNSTKEELTKHFNNISMLLEDRENANTNKNKTNPSDKNTTQRSSSSKERRTKSMIHNDSE